MIEAVGNFVACGNYIIAVAIVLLLSAILVSTATKESLDSVLRVEPLALELGFGVVKRIEGGQDSPLLRSIAGIDRQAATDAGLLVPPVRVTDNLQFMAGEYAILLQGAEIARHEPVLNCELAICSGGSPSGTAPTVEGSPTREPTRGIPAVWIAADGADSARSKGFSAVAPVSVLGTHLAELIRHHAYKLLSRQDTKNILDCVADENPKVIEDLVPKLLFLLVVQRVVQSLLRGRVSIRDAVKSART